MTAHHRSFVRIPERMLWGRSPHAPENLRNLSSSYKEESEELERLSKQDYQADELTTEDRIRLHRQMRLFLVKELPLFLAKELLHQQEGSDAIRRSLYYCDVKDRYYLYEYEVGFLFDKLVSFRQVEVRVTWWDEVIRHMEYEIVEE